MSLFEDPAFLSACLIASLTSQVVGICSHIEEQGDYAMKGDIKQAVILAAGMGTRLSSVLHDVPKGFLCFGDKPIIEESIETLFDFGIEQITIVTGYLSHYYEALSISHRGIQTVKNTEYDCSGSMYSFYLAKDYIREDFLLLESDLVYESRAIETLVNAVESDVLLISGFTGAGDEVFVEHEERQLVNMSKDTRKLKHFEGEFVGISKVSMALYEEMIRQTEPRFSTTLFVDYETDGLVSAARHRPVYCYKVEDLLWGEIDDEAHYVRVKTVVYPALHPDDSRQGSSA